MPEANATQIQHYADERIRPRSEAIVSAILGMEADKAAVDDIYAAVTGSLVGWTDARTDGPPHLLNAASVTSYNAYITDLIAYAKGHAEYANVRKACVRF